MEKKYKLYLCDNKEDALLVYVIKRWTEMSKIPLGRTIIQKLCYFLKKSGVPFDFNYELYTYGPFSIDLYDKMDELLVDGVIRDQYSGKEKKEKSVYRVTESAEYLIKKYNGYIMNYKETIDRIINKLKEFTPTQLELLSTILYYIKSYQNFYSKLPTQNEVVRGVKEIKKNKFSEDDIKEKYNFIIENIL